MSQHPEPKKVDIVAGARELATLMKANPSIIERALIDEGNNLVAMYDDVQASKKNKALASYKVKVLEIAIDDISAGVVSLRTCTVGVAKLGKELTLYTVPYGESPPGPVLFSISWKSTKAFKGWQNTASIEEFDQEQLNTAIYRLSAALARLI